MAKMKRVLRCFRCGAILQTEKPNEKGYVPAEMLKNASPDHSVLYCNHCFEDLKAINTGNLDLNIENDVIKILDDAVATDAFIIWVVDLFVFNGLVNKDLIKKIKDLKVVVVGTKRDLFPKSVKDEELKEYIKKSFNEAGLNIYGVKLFGSNDVFDSPTLLQKINKTRAGHDVYMIGTLSSGKTSIINKFLKSYSNNSRWQVTQEIYPGTRAKVLEIPLSNSSFFYELPSFADSVSVVNKIEKDIAKTLLPKKSIKISQRTLTTKDSLSIGNIASITLVKGKATLFKLVTGELVESRKILTSQIEDFAHENYRRRTLRPVSDRLNHFSDYDLFEYEMENDKKKHDISIKGLGWITFVATGQVIRVAVPKGVGLKESFAKVNI